MANSTKLTRSVLGRFAVGFLTCAGLLATNAAQAQDSGQRDETERDDSDKRDDTTTHIALDFDFGAALDEPGTTSGGGGALRIGREWDLILISLTPEIGGSYHAFGGDDQTRIYSGFLGGRFASELEFRARSEVLDVVVLVPGAGERLATDVDLTANRAQQRADSQSRQ